MGFAARIRGGIYGAYEGVEFAARIRGDLQMTLGWALAPVRDGSRQSTQAIAGQRCAVPCTETRTSAVMTGYKVGTLSTD